MTLGWSDLHAGETLHESPTSRVFAATRGGAPSSPAERLAVKRAKITEPSSIARFEAEAALLKECAAQAHGEHVIRVVAVIVEPPNYALVMPFYRHGSLYRLLHAPGAAPLERAAVLGIAHDVCAALVCAHSVGVVHRDVKPHNILLADDGRAILSDFGIAARASELEAEAAGLAVSRARPSGGFHRAFLNGTVPYMAPELIRHRPASFASDAYALGILANELATGAIPYSDARTTSEEMHTVIEARLSLDGLLRAVVAEGLRPTMPEPAAAPAAAEGLGAPTADADADFAAPAREVCPGYTVLCMRLWAPAPESRPTGAHALEVMEGALREAGLGLAEAHAATRDALKTAAHRREGLAPDAAAAVAGAGQASAPATVVRHGPALAPWAAAGKARDGAEAGVVRLSAAVEASAGPRGWDRMEDRAALRVHADAAARPSLCLVLDGHGGAACADFSARTLPARLAAGLAKHGGSGGGGAAAMDEAFAQAFGAADSAWLGSNASDDSGATALACVLARSTLHVAHVGDCRAVLCRAGRALPLNAPHTLAREDEAARIKAAGGSAICARDGSLRVGGVIEVTRSLGDRALRPLGLSPAPECTATALRPEDSFALLGTDGLWDVLPPAEAVRLALATARSAELIAKRLVGEALDRGTTDNVTVCVMLFN